MRSAQQQPHAARVPAWRPAGAGLPVGRPHSAAIREALGGLPEACSATHPCGHACGGVRGKSLCTPCLAPACASPAFPACRAPLTHPALEPQLAAPRALQAALHAKALLRLGYEEADQAPELRDPLSVFFRQPLPYALHRFAYYLCAQPYYGGEAASGVAGRAHDPADLVCPPASRPRPTRTAPSTAATLWPSGAGGGE